MDQKNHHIEDEHIVYHLNLLIIIRKKSINKSMQQLKQEKKERACKRKNKA
jgi:hypothetical protein